MNKEKLKQFMKSEGYEEISEEEWENLDGEGEIQVFLESKEDIDSLYFKS